MRENKLPLNKKIMKASCCVVKFLMTYVLLTRRENRDELLKEDVIPIWLITQNFQVNWAYAIVHYMSKFQRSNSVGLPYGSLIAKFLFKARIFLDNETLSSTSRKVIEKSQILIKVWVGDKSLEGALMEASDRKDIQWPLSERMFTSLLSISQGNSQAIQELTITLCSSRNMC